MKRSRPDRPGRPDGRDGPVGHAAGLDPALISRIRREFFARAAQQATRYSVTLDGLVSHLERANLAITPGPARVLSFIDDLVLAVACVRGHPRAWHDAWEKHESVLIRASRMRLEDSDAIIFARRFWIDLYATTVDCNNLGAAPRFATGRNGAPSRLGEFVGGRSLRIWLTDRLLGRLELETSRAVRGLSCGLPTGHQSNGSNSFGNSVRCGAVPLSNSQGLALAFPSPVLKRSARARTALASRVLRQLQGVDARLRLVD
ncbi:MAG: hypothetical protein SGJ11_05945 [Phycisphaerae bacterium]|nr:hypothetical protein [Phycisphaerae bacterium]